MKRATSVAALRQSAQPDESYPLRANLPGPSRRIVVEPIETPQPDGVPGGIPAEPADHPDSEPVPTQ